MIKFTEVVSEASSYNPDTSTVDCSYSLKTLFVNPSFIVEMRESEELIQKHTTTGLVEGLSEDIGFTKVVVSSGGSWIRTYNVVGHPQQLLASLREGV